MIFGIILTCLNLGLAKNIPIYLALKQKNIDVLQEYFERVTDPLSSNYGKYLTASEIRNIVTDTSQDENIVKDWLSSKGIQDMTSYGDSIKAYMEEKQVNQLFNRKYDMNMRSQYTIPKEIRQYVDFIEMDTNRRVLQKKTKINIKALNDTVDDRYFSRESSVYLYNLTHNSIQNKTIVGGVVEYQNNQGFSNSDINDQQKSNGQKLKNITFINGSNDGLDGESELDVQMVSQGADGVEIHYYNTPYWLYAFSVDLFNSEKAPDVISMSWGWAEDRQCDIIDCSNITSRDYVDRVNVEYMKLGLRGITITVSSGDAGSPGRTSEICDIERPMNAVFPGSSPYILSVGASYSQLDNSSRSFKTNICYNNSCITGKKETVISFDKIGWTSGSGVSNYSNSTPKWQRKQMKSYLKSGVRLPPKSSFNQHGRGYPDVTAIGHSCPTYIGDDLQKVDGTSCSSPVVTSLILLLNDVLVGLNKSKVGFVNPLLYHIYENCPDCFNDIIEGHTWCTENECCDTPHNFGFQATHGYDLASGLGSLNLGRIINYLKNNV